MVKVPKPFRTFLNEFKSCNDGFFKAFVKDDTYVFLNIDYVPLNSSVTNYIIVLKSCEDTIKDIKELDNKCMIRNGKNMIVFMIINKSNPAIEMSYVEFDVFSSTPRVVEKPWGKSSEYLKTKRINCGDKLEKFSFHCSFERAYANIYELTDYYYIKTTIDNLKWSIQDNIFVEYNSLGNLICTLTLIDNMLNGYINNTYEYGLIKNSKRHGTWTKIHDNSRPYSGASIMSCILYINGKRTGLGTVYYPNGTIIENGLYIDDLKDGLWSFYYSSGKLKKEGIMGKRDETQSCPIGKWYFYWENGRIMQEGNYNDKGDKIGCWKEYNEYGSLLHIYDYSGKKRKTIR